MSAGRQGSRLTVVLGNVTPPGRLDRAVGDAVGRLDAVDVTTLRLADLEIDWSDGSAPAGDAASAIGALEAADSVILATPVYRGSLTAALKNLIDWTPVSALRSKPVGLVTMGAGPHHYLGADRHLRDLMTFFGARVAPVSVYLESADFDSASRPGEAAQHELDALFETVLATGVAAPGGPDPLTENRRLTARR